MWNSFESCRKGTHGLRMDRDFFNVTQEALTTKGPHTLDYVGNVHLPQSPSSLLQLSQQPNEEWRRNPDRRWQRKLTLPGRVLSSAASPLDQSHTWVSDSTAHHQNFPNVTTVLEVRMECAGILISCCRNLIWYRLLVLLLDSFHQSLKRI